MRKIILIDDNLDLSGVLKTLLQLEGFQVITIGRASEAEILATVRREQPDFVLMDVYIHEVDGIHLLEIIKQDPAVASIIIMTSGMPLHEQCLRAGADDFLLKPYMPDELLALLRK